MQRKSCNVIDPLQAEEWNACLTRGNPAEIAAKQEQILKTITRHIMDEDENYHAAGWTPGQ